MVGTLSYLEDKLIRVINFEAKRVTRVFYAQNTLHLLNLLNLDLERKVFTTGCLIEL